MSGALPSPDFAEVRVDSHSPVASHPAGSPVEALRAGIRLRQKSPLSDPIWVRGVAVALACMVIALLARLPEGARNYFLAPLSLATVWVTIRMLLLDSAGKRAWRIVFLLGGVGLLIAGEHSIARVLLSMAALAFLFFRRYRPLRHLSSRRRAGLFGLGLIAFVALITAPGPAEGRGWFLGLLQHATGFSRFFLVSFWVFVLLYLFLGIRLHFLRLRPKLAIAGLLISAVPVLLLLSLGVVGFYGALGGSRSSQGQALMAEWLDLMGRDSLEESGPFGPGFGAYAQDGAAAPAWAEDVERSLVDLGVEKFPPAVWFRDEGELWVLRTPTDEGGTRLAGGRRVTLDTVTRLAQHLGTEVTLFTESLGDIDFDLQGFRSSDGDSLAGLCARPDGPVQAGLQDSEGGWLKRWIVFGAAPIAVWELDATELDRGQMYLNLRTRFADLGDIFFSEENDVNQAIALALIAVAILFVFFQLFALYFGVRIVGGMTSAVNKLHRATDRITEGDLDTWIEIPNEDEFGDLAASFNEMTSAIRLGQDQALQKERLEREVNTARQIQERLLPHVMPDVPGFQISGSSEPSRHVGGDYFDFLPLPDGRVGIAVGDVTGKGIPAALLMSNLQASLQGQALHQGPVAQQVRLMNDLLFASTDSHMFATFFYGILDPNRGTFTATNAGHDPPLLMRRDGTLERLRLGGLILGMLPDQHYREETIQMEPGDVLVLYTDGISEAMGPRLGAESLGVPVAGESNLPVVEDDDEEPDENFFEEDRLIEVVRRELNQSADHIRGAVLDAVSRFTAGIPQSDDITLVVIKRTAAIAAPERT